MLISGMDSRSASLPNILLSMALAFSLDYLSLRNFYFSSLQSPLVFQYFTNNLSNLSSSSLYFFYTCCFQCIIFLARSPCNLELEVQRDNQLFYLEVEALLTADCALTGGALGGGQWGWGLLYAFLAGMGDSPPIKLANNDIMSGCLALNSLLDAIFFVVIAGGRRCRVVSACILVRLNN